MVLHYQAAAAAALKEAKENQRSVPGRGLDFAVLRRLSAHSFEQCQPQIGLRCLLPCVLDDDAPTSFIVPQPIGHVGWPLALEIVLDLRGPVAHLSAWHDQRLQSTQVGDLLALLESGLADLAAHCIAQQHSEKTASDFSTSKLDQSELENIFSDLNLI